MILDLDWLLKLLHFFFKLHLSSVVESRVTGQHIPCVFPTSLNTADTTVCIILSSLNTLYSLLAVRELVSNVVLGICLTTIELERTCCLTAGI